MTLPKIALGLTLALVLAIPSSAAPVLTSFTGGGGPFVTFYGGSTGDVVGYSFTADINLTVTDLGILDDPLDAVLDSAHQVGLWDATTQVLLASISVDSTDTLIGGFFYATLGAPVNLTAGSSYVLGALYSTADDDGYWSGPTSVTLNQISNTVAVFPSSSDLGFVFPTETSDGNLGRIGPNMLAVPATVPEPSSMFLLSLGLAGFVATRRRVR